MMKRNRLIVFLLLPVVASCDSPGIYAPSFQQQGQSSQFSRITEAKFSVTGRAPLAKEISALVKDEKDYREVEAIVTAYCPCARCCGRMTGKTKTGTNAWRPGVAVCAGAVAYGSLVHVPGYERAELAVADDTGSAMRRAWAERKEILIDVRMTYHWEARQWGRQRLLIKVYPPPM